MKLKSIGLLALLALFLFPLGLRADVKDNANIFSPQAVDDANRAMQKMKETHNKEFVVETFAAIPDDQKAAYAQSKDTFFRTWMASRAKELKVNGVYVLICMDPKHLEGGVGKNTREHGDFTQSDLDNLTSQMRAALRSKDYDKALSDGVDDVERAYTANISEPNGRSSYTPRETEYGSGRYGVSPGSSGYPSHSSGAAGTFGTLICTIVGVLIIVSLIRSIFRGGGGGYSGGNYGGNYGSGYGTGYGQGYGQGGYGNAGGGGGFGRGLLGGLLGGALGSYVENRWENNGGNSSQQQGGFFGGGGSGGGGGGGSFDSGPSDAGQGFGDTSSGGDFGSSGGGGDSGGGGGSSGGDF